MSALELLPISSAKASNLAFTLLWLPRQQRTDALLFYRFCRTIDDIADEPGRTTSQKHTQLDAWLNALDGGLPQSLASLLERHAINPALLAEIILGCASDIEPRRFPTLADLEKYCWRVACAVGLVSVKIFGCRSPESEGYAIQLGHALQLTNILRDVGEDARQGRIYLPLDALEQFRVTEKEILSARAGPGFLPLMHHEATRARTRFAAAIPPQVDFKALLPARIMKSVYGKILHRLEQENFPVLQKRLRLTRLEKLQAVLASR
ncbi:MAG: phytoene/squalene synthase family protein [Terrimicrobiaceae bacterium]